MIDKRKIAIVFALFEALCGAQAFAQGLSLEMLNKPSETITTPNIVPNVASFSKPNVPNNTNSSVDWVKAKKICDNKQVGGWSSSNGDSGSFYEHNFEMPCGIVDQHFKEDDRHNAADEKISKEIHDIPDLVELDGILKGSEK